MLQDFYQQVYKIVAGIPQGKVATYGQIAYLLGRPRSARIVGWAMKGAADKLKLPCHRVVNKKGELAPDHAFGGKNVQRFLLESEGVTFTGEDRVDLAKHLWDV
ncbi:MAG: MGMT family protein [Peptococcaceae bacterium]